MIRLMIFGILCLCVSVHAMEVRGLQCESATTPKGITVARPHLSWMFVGDKTSDIQGGYRIVLTKAGQWSLLFDRETLAQGSIEDFDGNIWHQLKLRFRDKQIEGFVDGMKIVKVTHPKRGGYVSLASSYDENFFDNLEVSP